MGIGDEQGGDKRTNWVGTNGARLEISPEIFYSFSEWEPIDACDALDLLSPDFSHPFVRRYAVSRLQSTTYSNILLFLPQLVQALRYEPTQQDLASSAEEDMLIVTQSGDTDTGMYAISNFCT